MCCMTAAHKCIATVGMRMASQNRVPLLHHCSLYSTVNLNSLLGLVATLTVLQAIGSYISTVTVTVAF